MADEPTVVTGEVIEDARDRHADGLLSGGVLLACYHIDLATGREIRCIHPADHEADLEPMVARMVANVSEPERG